MGLGARSKGRGSQGVGRGEEASGQGASGKGHLARNKGQGATLRRKVCSVLCIVTKAFSRGSGVAAQAFEGVKKKAQHKAVLSERCLGEVAQDASQLFHHARKLLRSHE